MTPLRSVTSATTPGTSLRSTAPRRLASSAAMPGEFCAFALGASAATRRLVAKIIAILRFMEASLLYGPGVAPAALLNRFVRRRRDGGNDLATSGPTRCDVSSYQSIESSHPRHPVAPPTRNGGTAIAVEES